MQIDKKIFGSIFYLCIVVIVSTIIFDALSSYAGVQRVVADLLWLDIAGGVIFFAHQQVRDFFALKVGRKYNLWIIPAHVIQLSVAWIFFDIWTIQKAMFAFLIMLIVSYLMMYQFRPYLPPFIAAVLLLSLLFTPIFRVEHLIWFGPVFVLKLLWFYLAGTTATYREKKTFI